MNVADAVQEAAQSVGDTELPVATWPSGRLQYDFNGVATAPVRPQRKLFGLLSAVEVPPGTWGIGYWADEAPRVLQPGVHWFNNLQGMIHSVQLVDATRRRHEMEPVSGLTADGWRVTLWTVVLYEVADPLAAARAPNPRKALEAAGRAAILGQMETMTHQDLIGAVWAAEEGKAENGPTAGAGGLQQIEAGILARLQQRAGLEGLRIVEVAVVERQGDERLVEIMRAAEVERKQVREERETEVERAALDRLRLEVEAHTAEAARTTALIEAETKARLAEVEERLKLIIAQTEADVEEIRQVQEAREEERKRLAEEWRTAKQLDLKAMEYQHEQTLAIIQGTAQVTAEAARAGMLEDVQDRLWPQPGNAVVVGEGIQALRAFREQITAPTTHFLPPPVGPGGAGQERNRPRAEALRLARITNVRHELVLRDGELSSARVWFDAGAPPQLEALEMAFECPVGYPYLAPKLTLKRRGVVIVWEVGNWAPELFLADVVRDVMLEYLQRQPQNEAIREAPDSIEEVPGLHENGQEDEEVS